MTEKETIKELRRLAESLERLALQLECDRRNTMQHVVAVRYLMESLSEGAARPSRRKLS